MDNLSNLYLLLQVPSFSRWPLEVRFFCEDVYRKWQVYGDASISKVGSNVKVLLDTKTPISQSAEPGAPLHTIRSGGVEGIDATYAPLKQHLQKSMALLEEKATLQCVLCTSSIEDTQRATVCPYDGCMATSHLLCISNHFLKMEKQKDLLVPTVGQCPSCRRQTQWIDLVKEVSLRLRGQKEVASLMKIRKRRATKIKGPVTELAKNSDIYCGSSDEEEGLDDDEGMGAPYEVDMNDKPRLYGTMAYAEFDDEDLFSITSETSDPSVYSPQKGPSPSKYRRQGLDLIIEDSDWDDAEILD